MPSSDRGAGSASTRISYQRVSWSGPLTTTSIRAEVPVSEHAALDVEHPLVRQPVEDRADPRAQMISAAVSQPGRIFDLTDRSVASHANTRGRYCAVRAPAPLRFGRFRQGATG